MKKFKRNSLQYSIFFFTFLIVLIPLLVIGYISYANYKESITDNIKNVNIGMTNQISANFQFFLEDIHDLSLFFIQSNPTQELLTSDYTQDSYEFEQQKRAVEQLFIHLVGNKKYIQSVRIGDRTNDLIETHNKGLSLNNVQKEKLKELNGRAKIFINKEYPAINYSRIIKDLQDITQAIGYIDFSLNMNYVKALFHSENKNAEESFYLLDEQNEVILSKNASIFSDENLQSLLLTNQQHESVEIKVDGEDYIRTIKEIKSFPFQVAHIVSLDDVLAKNEIMPKMLMGSIIISLIICFLVAYYFSKFIVKPIKNLERFMKEVENDNLDVKFPVKGSNELAQLGGGFNSMLKRIKFLIEMVYIGQIRNKEAELKALNAKINPHFLYNTLDTIYWMSFVEGAHKSANMAHALSKLFRIILKRDENIITVDKELEYVRHYLDIQKIRYEDQIVFHLEIENGVESMKTVKMITQPLIENAIMHGMKNKEKGVIHIFVSTTPDYLDITVEDDGDGMDLLELEEIIHSSVDDTRGYALRNIHTRLQLESGKDGGLKFYQNDLGGLTVVARQKKRV